VSKCDKEQLVKAKSRGDVSSIGCLCPLINENELMLFVDPSVERERKEERMVCITTDGVKNAANAVVNSAVQTVKRLKTVKVVSLFNDLIDSYDHCKCLMPKTIKIDAQCLQVYRSFTIPFY